MPIYEYECENCGKAFEVFLGIKDKPVKKCTYCKSTSIRKLVSNCSFQLKGTGWYLTDYARKDDKKEEGDKKKEEGDKKKEEGDKKKEEKPKASESKASEKKDSGKAA